MADKSIYIDYYNALIRQKKEANLYTKPSNLLYLAMKLAEIECPTDFPKYKSVRKNLLLEIAEACYEPIELFHMLMEETPDPETINHEWCYNWSYYFDIDRNFLPYCAGFGIFNSKTIGIIMNQFGKELIEETERNSHTGHDSNYEQDLGYGLNTLDNMLKNHKKYASKRNK
jgi:hypothetical protein